ncbi:MULTISPECIES: hypothetical protein [unclassified Massilia]|uniref:hypothetical protein n=1 Tax=unclassified Massilia TaxID=2609279 RepID=UPI0017860080|nr:MULTISPECIES: hypothetical protein [unclassified Massilia]MBD8531204.1 hypothetical protein [Massilia sp. CFBP 13647]MBD8675040.1 hypothetical protein [Massilia sp. CFBP 13721]
MTFVSTLFRVAAPCLLAGVAHASPVPVPAADGGVPVRATVYTSALPYRPAAPEAVRPDQAWREQNRIVAAYDSMALTMGAHAGHAAPAADPHAAHAVAPDAHAGHGAMHGAAANAPADPHADHRMPAAPAPSKEAGNHADHGAAAAPAPAAHQHGGQP